MLKLYICSVIFSLSLPVMAQESIYKRFTALHFPVKLWVLTHPLKAQTALGVSTEVREEAVRRTDDPDFDGDYAGGQVDAFRHVFWMSYMASVIGVRPARSLGRAYERSNKIDFKKKLLEDNYLPDFVTSEMDYRNNEVGLKIFMQFPDNQKDFYIEKSKKAVLSGEASIVKKNSEGKFLTYENRIISEDEYLGKWFTPKTLVKSNFVRP